MSKVRIVFDVDDTICSNIRRTGYANSKPDLEVIKKINYLHDVLGYEIVFHTARGMISCNGDEGKIVEKNKAVLEDWLKKNCVHYDEIIFCKPIADLYVDDKAMNVKDFKESSFEIISGGGSNVPVHKMGDVIKKEFGSEKEANDFKDWLEENKGMCRTPKIYSYLYDAVYMEYIEGEALSECASLEDIIKLTSVILDFGSHRFGDFMIESQIEVLNKNKSNDTQFNDMIKLCERALRDNEKVLRNNASFSHGDMILSNIIKNKSGELYFIDPRFFKESSSFLLDFAKLKMSLSGYEYVFKKGKRININCVQFLDSFLKIKGLYDIVTILHLMYILRLYRYKDESGKEKVKNMANTLIKDNESIFLPYK